MSKQTFEIRKVYRAEDGSLESFPLYWPKRADPIVAYGVYVRQDDGPYADLQMHVDDFDTITEASAYKRARMRGWCARGKA